MGDKAGGEGREQERVCIVWAVGFRAWVSKGCAEGRGRGGAGDGPRRCPAERECSERVGVVGWVGWCRKGERKRLGGAQEGASIGELASASGAACLR